MQPAEKEYHEPHRAESAPCLLCNQARLEPLCLNRSFGVMIKKCAACGFIQSEYISKKALALYYNRYYRGPLTPQQIQLAAEKNHLQALSQMAYLTEILGAATFEKGLEIGAADGALAKLLKARTGQMFVTEADPSFARHLKAEKDLIWIDEADFDNPKLENYFDFIATSHVLEHLPDPVAALSNYGRMLKKNGYLFIDLPNEAQMLLEAGFQAKGHLCYFNPRTFKQLVERMGLFDMVESRTCNRRIEDFIASGFKLAEEYQREKTPNGTVIRALLRRNETVCPNGARGYFFDPQSTLDSYSARILDMYHHQRALEIRLDELNQTVRLLTDEVANPQKQRAQLQEQISPQNKPATSILTPATITRLEAFLNRIRTEVYPEPPSMSHQAVTQKMMAHVFSKCLLKPNSYTYIEVPAPDTACRHESNINHYSVLGKKMWGELIKRAGFDIVEVLDITLQVDAGQDLYIAFIVKKTDPKPTPI